MELSIKKSEKQAEILKMISLFIVKLDIEYCEQIAKDMMEIADSQESVSIIYKGYSQPKTDKLRAQGRALKCLVEYVKALKVVDSFNKEISIEKGQRDEISELFI